MQRLCLSPSAGMPPDKKINLWALFNIFYIFFIFGANRKTKLNVQQRDRNAKIDDPAPTVQSPPL